MFTFRIIPYLSTSSLEVLLSEGHIIRSFDPVSLPHIVEVHTEVTDRKEEFFRESDYIGSIDKFFWLWDISDRIGSIVDEDFWLFEIIYDLMGWRFCRSQAS